MAENMGKKGHDIGNMAPKVESFQSPESIHSQSQPGKTTDYISRQNAAASQFASKIKSKAYKGRYD